jgi:hypothetical protein
MNNLPIIIDKAGLSMRGFGCKVWPNMPHSTTDEKTVIGNKVNRYCKRNLKTLKSDLALKMCEVLGCTLEELYKIPEKTDIKKQIVSSILTAFMFDFDMYKENYKSGNRAKEIDNYIERNPEIIKRIK